MLQKMISEMLSQQQVLATRGRPHFRGLALALPKEGIDYKLGIYLQRCATDVAMSKMETALGRKSQLTLTT